MERAGPTPAGGIRSDDLVALADRPGPFATVSVGRSGTGAWGRRADEVGTTDVLSALTDNGAPDSVVARVGDALDSADAHGAVIVADESGVVLTEELPDPPRHELSRWAALPSITAVIEHRQAEVPSIVVLADRTGADLVVTGQGRDPKSEEVEGDEYPITKSAPGGWSQHRYQQRAEDSWERNADDVAARVDELAMRLSPELVVLGGDLRAVELIRDALPGRLQPITSTIAGGRAADGSAEARDEDIARLVRTTVAQHTVELLRALEQEEGRHARAANGAVETLHALQRSQVDVLLVHDDADDDRTAWFTGEPGIVAVDRDELEAMGSSPVTSARLVDVAVNAALRTGAGVRVVPDAAVLDEGIAAILRWPQEESQ
jgi:hypothetical protein